MIQMLTYFWGKKHLDIFINTSLRSLTWPKNFEALKGHEATWNIFLDDEDHDHLRAKLPKDLNINLKSTSLLREYIDQAQSAFMWQAKECLELKQRLIMAPPDLLFGDGTVPNMLKIGKDEGSVVVIPHVRVLPEAIKEITRPYSNAKLVTLAWKHLHRSWIDAEANKKGNTSFHGGVEWTRLDEKLISVTHRFPAPYLMDLTKEDVNYFDSQRTFNSLDHTWPGDILIPKGRQRFVGSSDACFLIEPTEEDQNIPIHIDGQPEFGGFWRDGNHNESNAMVRSIFRGE